MSLSVPARFVVSARTRHGRSPRSPRPVGTDKQRRVRSGNREASCRAASVDVSPHADTSVRSFLHDKTVVLTGSTGFLAKVFLEKLLWEQGDVRTVFLIIAPRGSQTAGDRLTKEIIATPLFDRLRERHGDGFHEFIYSKLIPVAGDLGVDDLGLTPTDLDAITTNCEIVVHSAATTTFNERFDVAVNINTLGAKRILDLAKQCKNLKVMCHVSTAFVNGLRVGDAQERAFQMGDSIVNELQNGDDASTSDDTSKGLDPYSEIALAFEEARRTDSHQQASGSSTSEKELNERLITLGTQRAKLFGWQDTYVFTKAMGEQLISNERNDVPVVIVRPSIVEGAFAEPFPGWIEGVRMADPLILAYGKGLISGFVGDKKGVLDIVPVDAVVNVMLASLALEGNKSYDTTGNEASENAEIPVYHVGTSTLNPLNFLVFLEIVKDYFAQTPLKEKKSGASIVPPRNISVFKSRKLFEFDTWLRQDGVRVMGTSILEKIKPGSINSADRRKNTIARKTWDQLRGMGELYEPYTTYAARFSSTNVKQLRYEMSDEDRVAFPFELEQLDWTEYLSTIHIPGLLKHALRVGVPVKSSSDKSTSDKVKPPSSVEVMPIVTEKA